MGDGIDGPPPAPAEPVKPTDPGPPALPGGAKGSVKETEQKPGKCGPTKTTTWTFTDGKHTTTVVEVFEYEGEPPNCKVIKHVTFTYTIDDSGATLSESTATGKPVPGKKGRKRWYKWVWKKGEGEPKKFIVTETKEGDKTVTTEEPVK